MNRQEDDSITITVSLVLGEMRGCRGKRINIYIKGDT